jgi:dUTP pyrophosphatase
MKIRGFEKISLEQWLKDCDFLEKHGTELYNEFSLPTRATAHSAGYDIYSTYDFTLYPGEEIKIPLGIKAYMQPDEFLMLIPRSSLGFKYYSRLANTVGVGDSDYYNNPGNEGHYWAKVRNEGKIPFTIEKGTAIVQAIFHKYLLVDGDEFSGEKRTGGLGSTTKA